MDKFPNLETVGIGIRPKCAVCPHLRTSEANVVGLVEQGIDRWRLATIVTSNLLTPAMHALVKTAPDTIEWAYADWINDLLKETMRQIIVNVTFARDLQANCPGAEAMPQSEEEVLCKSPNRPR